MSTNLTFLPGRVAVAIERSKERDGMIWFPPETIGYVAAGQIVANGGPPQYPRRTANAFNHFELGDYEFGDRVCVDACRGIYLAQNVWVFNWVYWEPQVLGGPVMPMTPFICKLEPDVEISGLVNAVRRCRWCTVKTEYGGRQGRMLAKYGQKGGKEIWYCPKCRKDEKGNDFYPETVQPIQEEETEVPPEIRARADRIKKMLGKR